MREPNLGGWPERLCITVHQSLCLSVVHDMIKWITGPIVCRELWYDEPSWGLVIDNAKAERRAEHVVQPLADRAGEGLYLPYPIRFVVVVGVEANPV